MRAEFFTGVDRMFTTVAGLQDALDKWVTQYNTERPHQSCGGRPPAERFALADQSITADDSALAPAAAARPVAGRRNRPPQHRVKIRPERGKEHRIVQQGVHPR
jgi:hypothetical protein